MGLRDTADQLDACKAQSVRDEQTIEDLTRQIAALEYDLARAESALAVRLQHDAHGHPDDGIRLTADDAALAVRAARHSAESIRSVLAVDPGRLHPDVAPYAERLDDLADRLTR